MNSDKQKIRKNFAKFYDSIPLYIRSIPSIIYLSVFSKMKIKGIGDISAFSIRQGSIKCKIQGKNCDIGKKVLLNAVIKLEPGVLIDDECKIIQGPVFFGKGTNFMFRSEIIGQVSIGRYCAIARKSVFQAQNHAIYRPSIQRSVYTNLFQNKLPSIDKGGIILGNDVWVGTQSIILPGVKIGDGAIIGAGSIVTKDIEPYSVVAGVPSSHIKYRFPENIRRQLLEIKWWDWSDEKIKKNKQFFMTDLTKVQNIHHLIK